jgi:hypothetical protein
MKKAEKIFGLLVFVALILNISLIATGSMFTVLILGLLSTFYMYVSFALFNEISFKNILKKETYKEIGSLRIVGAVLTGLAIATTLIGVLFTVQSWPGSKVNLSGGLMGLLIAFIVGFLKYRKSKSNYYINIFKRIVIYGGIGIVFYILPENSWRDFKYRNYPEYLKALDDARAEPNNQDLWDKANEEREKIN